MHLPFPASGIVTGSEDVAIPRHALVTSCSGGRRVTQAFCIKDGETYKTESKRPLRSALGILAPHKYPRGLQFFPLPQATLITALYAHPALRHHHHPHPHRWAPPHPARTSRSRLKHRAAMHAHTHSASALLCHRSSTAHAPILCGASSTPVCHRHEEAQSTLVNYNLPQCCHCGWRGDHAPTCPFK